MGAIIVVDGLWGDAGKGKITGYLCKKHNPSLCIRAGIGPNAGHSIYFKEGSSIILRQIPCGLLNEKTMLRIGSGVTVDPEIFLSEVKKWKLEGRAKLDLRCPIITNDDKEVERNHPMMIKIDSTKSGCGSARARFVMREARQAKDIPELREYVTDVAEETNRCADEGIVVIEGTQGTHMSLALSQDYPYVTSDNCTATSFADDVGLSWKLIDRVVMLVKCLPTRVGEGPLPDEMSWEEIVERGLQEYGVNTGRPRRKASTVDLNRLRYSAMLNGPTEVALTFCDQYDPSMKDKTNPGNITAKLHAFIDKIEQTVKAPVTLLDTGKWFTSIIDLSIREE